MTEDGKLYEIIEDPETGGEQLAIEGLEPIAPELMPEETEAEAILRDMANLQLNMDIMRYPAGDLNGNFAKLSFNALYDAVIEYVAQKTGANTEDVENPETRTQEQEALIKDTIIATERARMIAFFNSLYMEALDVLAPIKGTYNDPGEVKATTELARLVTQFAPARADLSLKEQAVLYFFALHGELDPVAAATETPLTDANKAELQDIFARLDAFYMGYTNGGTHDPTKTEILKAFIEHENPTPETAETIAANLQLVQSMRPKAHIMPNNPLMNALQQKQAINAGEFDLPWASAKGRRSELTNYTIIEYDPGETGIAITDANLSEYERAVSDAIISLWANAIKEKLPPTFTADMIFREMPGSGEKASPQQKGAITRAIEKFRRLHIYMDATTEFVKRGLIAAGDKYIIDENYLNVRRHTVQIKNGGAVVQGYEILSQPVMLTYSKMTGQILTVAAKHLAIESDMTPERQGIAEYMLRRIAIMKRDRKNKKHTQSNIILFDTLFADTGTKTDNRTQTMRNRKFCFEVLDYWKASGFIRGYEKQESGRSITGVIIEL